MLSSKAHIISRLQKDLLQLSGLKALVHEAALPAGLGFLKDHLPQAVFPLAAVHEFISNSNESFAATEGFVSALISGLLKTNASIVWISTQKTLYPPALNLFDIDTEKIIFIHLLKEKELLWATEEALKSKGLAAVVCEMPELSFTSSRRFQLAVEQSAVTGFILRLNPRKITTTACVSRWRISSLASDANGMPGVGYPSWNVELEKIRNGKPGSWQVEWKAGKFNLQEKLEATQFQQQKKTG